MIGPSFRLPHGTIFGTVPRVTRLSCYWATLRHVVRLIDTAVVRAAENVLIIGSKQSFISTIADHLPGLHGLVSMSDLKTGNLAKAFDRLPKWDLCVCNLELAELAEVSTILTAIRPVMSNGGTIIGFYLNYDATPVTMDGASIDSMSRLRDTRRFYFAGSAGSARVIRKHRQAANAYRTGGYPIVRWAMAVLRLLKIAPLALVANRTEAAIAPEGFPAPPPACTSVTIEVVVDANT